MSEAPGQEWVRLGTGCAHQHLTPSEERGQPRSALSPRTKLAATRGRSNFQSPSCAGRCRGKAGPCRDDGHRCGRAPAPAAATPRLGFPKQLKASELKGLPGSGRACGSGLGKELHPPPGQPCPRGQARGRAGGLALGCGAGRGPEEEPLSLSLCCRAPSASRAAERGVRAAPDTEEEEAAAVSASGAPARDAGGTVALLPLLGHLPRRQGSQCEGPPGRFGWKRVCF